MRTTLLTQITGLVFWEPLFWLGSVSIQECHPSNTCNPIVVIGRLYANLHWRSSYKHLQIFCCPMAHLTTESILLSWYMKPRNIELINKSDNFKVTNGVNKTWILYWLDIYTLTWSIFLHSHTAQLWHGWHIDPHIEITIESTPDTVRVVIMWSNITWYCIHNCRNWGRI